MDEKDSSYMPYFSDDDIGKIEEIVSLLRDTNEAERELNILFAVLKERVDDKDEEGDSESIDIFSRGMEYLEQAIEEIVE